MFRNFRFRQAKPLLLFFAVYTVLFLLFAATFSYTLPFLIGFLLALLVQPLLHLFQKRLRMPKGLASLFATLLVFLVIFGLLFLLGYYIILEIGNLVNRLSSLNGDQVNAWLQPFYGLMDRVDAYLQQMHLQPLVSGDRLEDLVKSALGFLGKGLTGVMSILTQLPTLFMMLLVTMLSMYFFAKDMDQMKGHLRRLLGGHRVGSLRTMQRSSKTMGWRVVGSYLLIYGVTFLESFVVFLLLQIPYPLMFAVATGIADVIPVLGPGTIYIPMALFYMLAGNWSTGGILLLGWVLITAVRQVIEPKILASSIRIHPLSMLAAIYFALVAQSLTVLLYFIVLFILYALLVQAGYLPPLLESLEQPEEKHTTKVSSAAENQSKS